MEFVLQTKVINRKQIAQNILWLFSVLFIKIPRVMDMTLPENLSRF
jgi:hypothetical protein